MIALYSVFAAAAFRSISETVSDIVEPYNCTGLVKPPSTIRLTPVTLLAAGLDLKPTALATIKFAMALPIPLLPPVMTTFLPCSPRSIVLSNNSLVILRRKFLKTTGKNRNSKLAEVFKKNKQN